MASSREVKKETPEHQKPYIPPYRVGSLPSNIPLFAKVKKETKKTKETNETKETKENKEIAETKETPSYQKPYTEYCLAYLPNGVLTAVDLTPRIGKTPMIMVLGGDYQHIAAHGNIMGQHRHLFANPNTSREEFFSAHRDITHDGTTEEMIFTTTPSLSKKNAPFFDKLLSSEISDYSVSAFIYLQPARRNLTSDDEAYELACQAANRLHVPLVLLISSIDPNQDPHQWWAKNKADHVAKYGARFNAALPIHNYYSSIHGWVSTNQRIQNICNESRDQVIKLLETVALPKSKAMPIIDGPIFRESKPTALVKNGVFKLSPENNKQEEPSQAYKILFCCGG